MYIARHTSYRIAVTGLAGSHHTQVSSHIPISVHTAGRSTYRIAVVGPAGPLHLAALDVEREVLDVHVARGLVDAVREPRHLAVAVDDDVRVDDGRAVLRVGAAVGGACRVRREHPAKGGALVISGDVEKDLRCANSGLCDLNSLYVSRYRLPHRKRDNEIALTAMIL